VTPVASGKTYIAGHRGLVGSAIVRALHQKGRSNIVVRSRAELDLEDGAAVTRFFENDRPEIVYLAAAKVGGILANSTMPADSFARTSPSS
jgi:GDP-L-fucose synthase